MSTHNLWNNLNDLPVFQGGNLLVHEQAVHQSAGTVEHGAHGADEREEVVIEDECLTKRLVEAGYGLRIGTYLNQNLILHH